MDQVLQRLRVSKVAESQPIQEFWRSHGEDWAREEADANDLAAIGAIADRVAPLPRQQAIAETVDALKAIWREGFRSREDAFAWNEMYDHLPDSAYLSFVEGAASVWKQVQSRL